MLKLLWKNSMIMLTALTALTLNLSAADATTAVDTKADSTATSNEEKQKADSTSQTQTWLGLLDQGKYGETFDAGSVLMQRTMTRDEWNQLMQATRAPLGSLKSRQISQQLPAQDPKGLPAGDYMVILYSSSFSNRPSAQELVTLSSEDGKWKVITYMVE